LPNNTRFGFVTICKKKPTKDNRWKVPCGGWILGKLQLFARLQDIWDNDKMFIPSFLDNLSQPPRNNQ
jgi:hypothetical protein